MGVRRILASVEGSHHPLAKYSQEEQVDSGARRKKKSDLAPCGLQSWSSPIRKSRGGPGKHYQSRGGEELRRGRKYGLQSAERSHILHPQKHAREHVVGPAGKPVDARGRHNPPAVSPML